MCSHSLSQPDLSLSHKIDVGVGRETFDPMEMKALRVAQLQQGEPYEAVDDRYYIVDSPFHCEWLLTN